MAGGGGTWPEVAPQQGFLLSGHAEPAWLRRPVCGGLGTEWARGYARAVRFYGIVDEETQEAVELYVRREDAERFWRTCARLMKWRLAAVIRASPW